MIRRKKRGLLDGYIDYQLAMKEDEQDSPGKGKKDENYEE